MVRCHLIKVKGLKYSFELSSAAVWVAEIVTQKAAPRSCNRWIPAIRALERQGSKFRADGSLESAGIPGDPKHKVRSFKAFQRNHGDVGCLEDFPTFLSVRASLDAKFNCNINHHWTATSAPLVASSPTWKTSDRIKPCTNHLPAKHMVAGQKSETTFCLICVGVWPLLHGAFWPSDNLTKMWVGHSRGIRWYRDCQPKT